MFSRGWTSSIGKISMRHAISRSSKSPTKLCTARHTSSSAYTTAFLDVIKDVGHPARHLSYPKATPLYEQLKPVPSIRYTKPLLFLTALAVSLAMDFTWTYWPQKATTVTKEDGSTEEVLEPRPINHRLLMLAMHLGIGASMAAYLVNRRRLHVHKIWLLPKNVRKKRGKSSLSSLPSEMTMDVMVKTYSWHAPRLSSMYRPDFVSFVPSGENVILRVASEHNKQPETFILRTKDVLVDGKAVPPRVAKEFIVNSLQR
ncbi:hypothetical protein V8B97DRAFT_2057379 [Scleroderma yunnanense]